MRTRRFRSYADAIRHFDERGWSDGLPVVPPTAGAVTDMLSQRNSGSVGKDFSGANSIVPSGKIFPGFNTPEGSKMFFIPWLSRIS